MANNGADVKPNQGVGATNTSTTTNTAENTVGTATPKQNGLAVLGKYVGVSATQTIVEYATFAILHLIGVPSQIANGIAVVCSATYNFVMNRNVTFKSSSNFTRSVAPLHDLLALGEEARINAPSTLSTKNWSFRYPKAQLLSPEVKETLLRLTLEYRR